MSEPLGRATEEARAAAEVELRVKRRIGELLPPPVAPEVRSKSIPPKPGGIDHRRASEFRKLAEVPAEAFEGYLEEPARSPRAS